jgi:WD40 repeat protein
VDEALGGGTLTDPDGYRVKDVALSPDGKTIAGSVESADGTAGRVDLWHSAGTQPAGQLSSPAGGGLAFNPDDPGYLAVADGFGIDLWNLNARSTQVYTEPDGSQVADVAYTPDGKSVAEFDANGRIYLLDPADGQWSAQYFTDPAVNQSVQPDQVLVSPDGKTLAGADSAGNVDIWSLAGGSPVVITGAAKRSANQTLAFTSDGKTLAIADQSGDIRLWNVAASAVSARLTGPGTLPQAVAFSPNGKTLAVGDGNGDIYLWDLAAHTEFNVSAPASGADGITSLRFSPDGGVLAASSNKGAKVYLYSIKYAAS